MVLLVPPSFSGTPLTLKAGRPAVWTVPYTFSFPVIFTVLGYPGRPGGRRTLSSWPYLRWYGSERSTDLPLFCTDVFETSTENS